jgi:hypothetical protein
MSYILYSKLALRNVCESEDLLAIEHMPIAFEGKEMDVHDAILFF